MLIYVNFCVLHIKWKKGKIFNEIFSDFDIYGLLVYNPTIQEIQHN